MTISYRVDTDRLCRKDYSFRTAWSEEFQFIQEIPPEVIVHGITFNQDYNTDDPLGKILLITLIVTIPEHISFDMRATTKGTEIVWREK